MQNQSVFCWPVYTVPYSTCHFVLSLRFWVLSVCGKYNQYEISIASFRENFTTRWNFLVSVLVVFNFKNAVGHTLSRQNKQTNKQTKLSRWSIDFPPKDGIRMKQRVTRSVTFHTGLQVASRRCSTTTVRLEKICLLIWEFSLASNARENYISAQRNAWGRNITRSLLTRNRLYTEIKLFETSSDLM